MTSRPEKGSFSGIGVGLDEGDLTVIHVLVVDDQPLIRTAIAMLVNAEPDMIVTAEAAHGEEAIAKVRAHCPDVVVMDVRMPGIDGVQATRLLVEEGITTRTGQPLQIIILTTYHIDEAVYGALRAGASGFLLKDAAPDEVVSAIRAVAAGEGWLDPAVTRRLLTEFAARPEQHKPSSAEMQLLTPREREVLALLARGLSNADVAGRLFISEATVKTHLARVMMKLGVREKAQAVAAAYQTGLVQVPPR
jgi:DNA-binding NarL/FixJ family response regulator